MRYAALLILLAVPASAWEFSPDPICTLTHQTQTAEITITYDAALPEYTLAITVFGDPWPREDTFHMVFLGSPERLMIGTSLHQLSEDGQTLTVRDQGFGNVLDGLEFRNVGVARTGSRIVDLKLDDAPPAVRAFRACPDDTPATS